MILEVLTANSNEILYREKLISLALSLRHLPYIHGEHEPDSFDCAGFVWYLYHEILAINLYEDGFGQSTSTKIMTSSYGTLTLFDEKSLQKDLKIVFPGDILFFHRQSLQDFIPSAYNKYPGHCGIYIKEGRFIHCTKICSQVVISKLEKDSLWYQQLVAKKGIF